MDDQYIIPKGYFINNYGPLSGRAWMRNIPEYERKAVMHVLAFLSEHGRLGGKVRAATARRDKRGRFAPN